MHVNRRTLMCSLGALAGAKPLAAFGARLDESDAGPRFASAIAELARLGGGRLKIPPGVYTFAAESGVALSFVGLKDVDIEAEGAEFSFRGIVRPLMFRQCHGVRVHGLTISWARPPFSQGDVDDVAADGKSATIKLDQTTPMDGWTRVEAIGEYDRDSGLISRHGFDVYNAVEAVIPIDSRHVRLRFRRPISIPRPGAVVLRHAIYEAHAIDCRDCSDVRFDNVTVHSAPGMAFVGNRCSNITLSRCEIAPKMASGLLMSTNADGAHFSDCSGEIILENCHFAAMGDDGVNVNGAYWRIVGRPDKRTVVATQLWERPFQ